MIRQPKISAPGQFARRPDLLVLCLVVTGSNPLHVLAASVPGSFGNAPAVDISQAEQGSIELSQFLSQAPTDFLEPLLKSPFGRVYTLFLERCCTSKFPGTESEKRRNALSQQLRQVGCDTPEGWAVLLSLFPLFPPEQLKVEDASAKLPDWLLTIYESRYEAWEPSLPSPSPTASSAFEDRVPRIGSSVYPTCTTSILRTMRSSKNCEVRLQTVKLILYVGRDELASNSKQISVTVSGPWHKVAFKKKASTLTKFNKEMRYSNG